MLAKVRGDVFRDLRAALSRERTTFGEIVLHVNNEESSGHLSIVPERTELFDRTYSMALRTQAQ